MKKLMIPIACAVSAAGLFCGCYSPKVTTAKYSTKAFAEVSLAANATIKIVSRGVDGIVPALKEGLQKSDQKFTVTDGPAQYWIFITGLDEKRVDSAAQAVASAKVGKRVVGLVDGKPCVYHEEIVSTAQSSYAVANGVSVAIYQADTLVPVSYFEVPVYDGEIVPNGAKAPTADQISAYLSNQVLLRIKDVTATADRNVEVDVPAEASPAMIKAFCDKAVADKKDVKGVLAAAKVAVPQPFAEFAKAVQSGAYKEKDVQTKLSDYYILALARELGCLDTTQLKEIRAMQLGILQLAATDSLAKCCPAALARLEYKLACLGVKL